VHAARPFDEARRLLNHHSMATALMTYEDYVALPDDGNRYEVIEGELCLVPAPNRKHQRITLKLAVFLSNFVDPQHLGEVYVSPFDVRLSDINVVQPDLLYVSAGRLDIMSDAGAMGAPDLAVEVLSTSTRRRDEVTKLRLYESFGVDEYWIVDASRVAVRVYRRVQNKLALVSELLDEDGVMLTTPLLPGLVIPVAVIFED
jgi:Uma2 family endonuclease